MGFGFSTRSTSMKELYLRARKVSKKERKGKESNILDTDPS